MLHPFSEEVVQQTGCRNQAWYLVQSPILVHGVSLNKLLFPFTLISWFGGVTVVPAFFSIATGDLVQIRARCCLSILGVFTVMKRLFLNCYRLMPELVIPLICYQLPQLLQVAILLTFAW